ncbi:MAG: hypothetical protein ACK5YR_12540 [Pirellula sp.]|jgi:hypothetical protein
MLSEEQKKSKSTAQGDWGCGSLQSMNLGALLVGQLSQAINWSNDTSFKRPECKPWVDLPAVSGEPKNEQSNSEVTPTPVVSTQAIVEDKAPQVTQEAFVEVNNSAPPDAPSAESVQVAIESTEKCELTPPAIESSEQVAIVESTADASVELARLPSEVAAESVAVEVVKNDLETSPNLDQSAIGSLETSKSQRKLDDQTKVETSPSEKSTDVSSAESPITSDSNQAYQPVPTSKVATSVDKIELDAKPSPVVKAPRQDSSKSKPVEQVTDEEVVAKSAKPLPRPSYQVAERIPLGKAVSKSPGGDMPQDDYLVQLERLVVELNMELARVRGEEATVDPIEQMANRIIALNLENLALREQLQQSNPKS